MWEYGKEIGSHELDQCLLSLFPNTAGGLWGAGRGGAECVCREISVWNHEFHMTSMATVK